MAMSNNFYKQLLSRDRGALARCITLVESTLPVDRMLSVELMKQTTPYAQTLDTFRIGVCGPPGAGKSTFIEALGKKFIADKHRAAVLAIDPSSSISGGSILGDKVRMPFLSTCNDAYVRSSPSKCSLGGITPNTVDVISLCECGGYDTILVESVGIGQSEVEISQAVDMLIFVIAPGAGDDIQAMKKGIMEVIDMIVVNKADGALLNSAKEAYHHYTQALQLRQKRDNAWNIRVKLMSSTSRDGADDVYMSILQFKQLSKLNDIFLKRRSKQSTFWMWNMFKTLLIERALNSSDIIERGDAFSSEFQLNTSTPRSVREAATLLVDGFLKSK
jgi:LAO/AO transport system kinase